MTRLHPIFAEDLERIFAQVEPLWPRLKDARILMTGGTGFIGRWLLESLRLADERLGLGVHALVLTRDPEAYAERVQTVAGYPAFQLVGGDVLNFVPPAGDYSHIIHAATDASANLNEHDPRRMFDTIVAGTRHLLDFAVAQKVERFFNFSSGAVYGQQPWEASHIAEDWRGAPDCLEPRNAYGEGKRAAEMLCAIYAKQFGLDFVNARIFGLLGPLLSLDAHFAAGNFIRDALQGQTIRVQGAGTAVRSYLYAADLATWLWTMFLSADSGATFNVGSEEAVSIAQLAGRIDSVLKGGGVEILGKIDMGWNPGRYVPSTALIRERLGLVETVGLDDAIRRTALWNGWKAR